MRTCSASSLSEDSKAAARWSLESGGEYYGVGAGTGISGFRANLGVGDDLFGSREDAYSETVRQKRWDWYQDDFSARLKPERQANPDEHTLARGGCCRTSA